MKLYREFFEARGWDCNRLNMLTPKQLAGIAGGAPRTKTYASVADAAADYLAKKRAREGD